MPLADFFLTSLGNGSLVIDAGSIPQLQTGVNYYLIAYSQATDLGLPYSISGSISGSPGTTMTQPTTSTATTSSATTSRASTTATTTLRPPFNPNLMLSLSTLQAGNSPEVNFTCTQVAGEINLRSEELLSGAGRLDFAGLTVGKVLGTATTNFTSLKYPDAAGTASTVHRISQTFAITP